jgi:hypothetical protein
MQLRVHKTEVAATTVAHQLQPARHANAVRNALRRDVNMQKARRAAIQAPCSSMPA